MDTPQTLLYPETTVPPWMAANPSKDTAITNLLTAEPSVKNLNIEGKLYRLRCANSALWPLTNEANDISYVAFHFPP